MYNTLISAFKGNRMSHANNFILLFFKIIAYCARETPCRILNDWHILLLPNSKVFECTVF